MSQLTGNATDSMEEAQPARDGAARDGVPARPPSVWSFALKVAASVGLTGMICCVAPMVLFMLGLAGGVWAVSFADFFYEGTNGVGAWALRGFAGVIALGGILYYRRKQNQCSIDPARRRLNLVLASVMILVLGVGLFITLERVSGWYFNEYIVPAQQAELEAQKAAGEGA